MQRRLLPACPALLYAAGDACVRPTWGDAKGRLRGVASEELFDGCQHSDSYFIKDCTHVVTNVVQYRNFIYN